MFWLGEKIAINCKTKTKNMNHGRYKIRKKVMTLRPCGLFLIEIGCMGCQYHINMLAILYGTRYNKITNV